MEIKVAELINRSNTNPKVEGEIDYKNKISDEILDVDLTKVSGPFEYLKEKEGFLFHLHVQTAVTGVCVITLKPTKILVDFDTDLFYTFKVTDDDSFEIINNTIYFDDIVWGEIILHMPIRIISEGAEFHQDDYYEVKKSSPFSSLGEKKEEE